jgi:endoglucanase
MADAPWLRKSLAAQAKAGSTTRRQTLLGLLGVGTTMLVVRSRATRSAGQPAPDTESAADWQAFVARFVTPEGRVVDTGNGGVTHSEGQGYGLLFAEHFDDRATFDSVLAWTRQGLRRPHDSLHAWRYRPNAAVPVDDLNNATDGDLLIALALLRAGQRWGSQAYTDLGCAIGADILANCVCAVGGATILLPAAFGFTHPGRVIVNPSYYLFPALATLADYVPDPAWAAVQEDGLRLLRMGRFGRWRLPSDWLEIRAGSLDTLTPAQGWPARFSWDAVRVPLNLIWGGLADEPAIAAAAAFWADPGPGGTPAWVDLDTGAFAPYVASRGVAAIAALTRAARSGVNAPALPHVADAEDYYAAALVLLCRMVSQETRRAAV